MVGLALNSPDVRLVGTGLSFVAPWVVSWVACWVGCASPNPSLRRKWPESAADAPVWKITNPELIRPKPLAPYGPMCQHDRQVVRAPGHMAMSVASALPSLSELPFGPLPGATLSGWSVTRALRPFFAFSVMLCDMCALRNTAGRATPPIQTSNAPRLAPV